MTNTARNTRNLRRWAVAAVAANIAAAVVLGLVLPAHAAALLPVFGLMLPLVTVGILDAVLVRQTGRPSLGKGEPAARPSQPHGRLTPAFGR